MPKTRKRVIYLHLLASCFVALFVCLYAAPAKADDPADYQSEIAAVEAYLSGLKTAKARFVQTAHDGSQLVGTFYLSRPGKLRFEYDLPIEDFVVADGTFIYFYDSELQEQMNMPIGQSLADFILREDVSFNDNVLISDVKNKQNLLQISLVQADDPAAGSLTFAFTQNPLRLKKWRITDPQNMITEVELFYLESDIALDEDLFRYIDPNHGKVPSYNE